MSQPAKKTLDDVRAAFETRRILQCSSTELQELLVAVGSETISDPAGRSRATEMGETMRQLLETRRREDLRRKPSKVSLAALALSLAALLCSGAQAFYWWSAYSSAANSARDLADFENSQTSAEMQTDSRTHMSIVELAKRSPTMRTGTLQAWWAGEQARQVQRLEAQAKRQALAGDREGATRSVSRADAIRRRIPSLAEFEQPRQR